MKCDKCHRSASVHLIEIKLGKKKIEEHLCEACATAKPPQQIRKMPPATIVLPWPGQSMYLDAPNGRHVMGRNAPGEVAPIGIAGPY